MEYVTVEEYNSVVDKLNEVIGILKNWNPIKGDGGRALSTSFSTVRKMKRK